MKKALILFCFFFSVLSSEKVDVVADFYIFDIPINWEKFAEKDIQVRFFHHYRLDAYLSSYSPDVKKVIVMNNCFSSRPFSIIPKEKLILFHWEPDCQTYLSDSFSCIYTYNDSLVNGKKFKKFYYPFLEPRFSNPLPFHEKKLCTMVVRHWTKERIDIVNFFEKKPDNEFEYYGSNYAMFRNNKMYKGVIPGLYNSAQKKQMLNNYKFSFCFENSFIPGYITEKILVCLSSGCVPIYLGAPNILDYIPKGCFIDFRDFNDLQAVYSYIKNLSEEDYNQYQKNISEFLESKKADLFYPSTFEEILFDAVKE